MWALIIDSLVKVAVIVLPFIFAKNSIDTKKGNDVRRWQLIESLAPIAFLAVESIKKHVNNTNKMSPKESLAIFLGKLNALLEGMNQKPIQKKEMEGIEKLAETHAQANHASNGVR